MANGFKGSGTSGETEAGSMRPGTRSQGVGCGSAAVRGVGGEGARLEGLPSPIFPWGDPEVGEAGGRGGRGDLLGWVVRGRDWRKPKQLESSSR